MGYYTTYELTTIHRNLEHYVEAAIEIGGGQKYSDIYNAVIGYKADETKWYSFESEMLELSRRFPDEVFILTGVGEGLSDIWRAVFHNGQTQTQKVVIYFPEDTLAGVRVKEQKLG